MSANHGAASWEMRHGGKTLTVLNASWQTSTLRFQSRGRGQMVVIAHECCNSGKWKMQC